ncbi:MOSC domain-containing protein [Bacillus massilinigeriensis]|uniref:MOSC domain-containing protein n=1 Tax=Bacillus mediterraneensis TaxID=1805474 RepID=UPI0008F8AE0A|nr:MOSC domain-containing protein [Bacillus mediterraneensis]
MEGIILSLNIGLPVSYHYQGKIEKSAIGKSQVRNAVVLKHGILDDGVANEKFHGGFDRAVCLYSYDHYSKWEQESGKFFMLPAFGENMTVSGMLEENVYIGDIYKAGSSILQISQGRIPCNTISKYNGVKNLLDRVVATGYTGYFFRVLKEGVIAQEDQLELLEREQEDVSILKAHKLLYNKESDISDLQKVVRIPSLANAWKEKLSLIIDRKQKQRK